MEKSDDRVQGGKCEIENGRLREGGKILENASYMKVIWIHYGVQSASDWCK